ncbi:MAG TPA: glycosyltransferase family 2 protein [Acidimicrobiales bacterium]|nr:glycosyltransferase family 2 protein [Acidimicrobiales bacterium]
MSPTRDPAPPAPVDVRTPPPPGPSAPPRAPAPARPADPPGSLAPVVSGDDPDVVLLRPLDDVEDPEVSIVVPAVDEELTISDFVAWCRQGLADAGARGEILIVDSSTDGTAELALAGGARVLRTPKRGLGRAYIDALPFVRGRYVVMGDADCTYDFRLLGGFVEQLRQGYDFAMGSRWRGSIEPGSMPALHRYLGTPVTTWILNRLYGSRFTDIHCGMRGITRDALERMGLVSQSWEYASEMVLKSVRMNLRTTEVPVTFYRDREGRVSHHKRAGWFSPFQAAWINLRAMFIYRAEFFALKPGLVFLAVGLLLTVPLSFGTFTLGPVTFSLYWMLAGATLAVLGLQSFFFGVLAQILCDYSGEARVRWTGRFRYTPAVLGSIALFLLGLGLAGSLVVHWLANNFSLPPAGAFLDHLAVTGTLFMIMGFSSFCFTLLLYATGVRYGTAWSERSQRGGAR